MSASGILYGQSVREIQSLRGRSGYTRHDGDKKCYTRAYKTHFPPLRGRPRCARKTHIRHLNRERLPPSQPPLFSPLLVADLCLDRYTAAETMIFQLAILYCGILRHVFILQVYREPFASPYNGEIRTYNIIRCDFFFLFFRTLKPPTLHTHLHTIRVPSTRFR